MGLWHDAAITYIVWGVTYTMMDIPFWSMIPAFTEGGKERENLTTMARSCSGVGSALVTIITMKCVYMLGQGNERTGFRWFALIVAVLFVLFITITCLTIREKFHGSYGNTDRTADVFGADSQRSGNDGCHHHCTD